MRKAWFALLGLVLALGSACDSEPDLHSYTELLRFVPNDPEYRRWITVTDYEALRSLPPPEESDGLSAMQDLALRTKTYTSGVALEPLALRGAVVFPEIVDNWETALGLSLEEAERSLSTGPPEGAVGVLVGSFDADAMVNQLKACDECTQPTEVTRGRNSYYDWGSDLGAGERFGLPVFDNLGRGGTYRFTDRYILRGPDRESITRSLDAVTEGASALEHPGFRELARVMDQIDEGDDIDLLAVRFTDLVSGPTTRTVLTDSTLEHPTVATALQQEMLRPYESVALASGVRDRETVTVLLLTHDTTASAEQNVSRLADRLATTVDWGGQPWSTSFSAWEIEVDGTTIIATLEGQAPLLIALAPVPLLFHE